MIYINFNLFYIISIKMIINAKPHNITNGHGFTFSK